MADNTTIYPNHAIEIIAWHWPELSNDIPGDYSVASVGDGTVKLNWTTTKVAQPTPEEIDALRQSDDWRNKINRVKWKRQAEWRKRQAAQKVIDSPDSDPADRVRALQQLTGA
jgi:hypothetical protein